MSRTHRIAAAAGAVALVACGLAWPGPVGSSTQASGSANHPFRFTAKHALHVRPAGTPDATQRFGCQKTTPVSCFGPDQIRKAYGFDAFDRTGLLGQGTTIVIVDAFQAPHIRADVKTFDAFFALPDADLTITAPDGQVPFDRSDGDQQSWAGEISLDVQWAHTVAPRAAIHLVLARTDSDADFESAIDYVAAHRLGNVVSQSYSSSECDLRLVRAAHRSFVTMVANGTTPVADTGDWGPAQFGCHAPWERSAGNPGSDPLVTAVGGTALSARGPAGTYEDEKVWKEQRYDVAGGSGLSTVYAEPLFQAGVQQTGRRSVPDVSLNSACGEGYLVVNSSAGYGPGTFLVYCGTSVATPIWAALIDLSSQLAGHRLGTVNPALYRLGASSPRLFHDVTRGTNTITLDDGDGTTSTFQGVRAHAGWDFATGLGSPRADLLVPALAAASP